MTITLSICSIPSIESCVPGVSSVPCSSRCRTGASVPVTREDLPDPETPVTATMQPSGILTSRSWRLFCLAPFMTSHRSSWGLNLSSGRGISDLPDRYAPVMLSSLVINSSNVPLTTISPPSLPAPGPMSTIQSACLKVASSCSTTMRVLPRSVSSLSVSSSLPLSLGWSPMLGSSRTYITPVSLVPI